VASNSPPEDDLDEVLVASWRLLARGTADRRAGFHTMTAATIGLDGRPRARTVILRGVDPLSRTLRFHCDRRTEKFTELSEDPRIALHGYDADTRIQLRIEGRAALHTDDAIAEEAWGRSPSSSRANYGTMPAPGTIIRTGGDYSTTPVGKAAGRDDFCAVLVRIDCLEFLHLAPEGHRRARFRWESGRVEATWLAP
jgi:pyridoxamine 5'-phosphate oxidase